jgi:hypothetical protein
VLKLPDKIALLLLGGVSHLPPQARMAPQESLEIIGKSEQGVTSFALHCRILLESSTLREEVMSH